MNKKAKQKVQSEEVGHRLLILKSTLGGMQANSFSAQSQLRFWHFRYNSESADNHTKYFTECRKSKGNLNKH